MVVITSYNLLCMVLSWVYGIRPLTNHNGEREMTQLLRIMLKGFFTVSLCILLIACSRVSQSNFDKIQPGMSMEQVVAILGEPSDSQSITFGGLSGTSATWKNNDATITLQFLNDKMQIKSFLKTTDQTQPVAGNT
jgi:hypothetical protein